MIRSTFVQTFKSSGAIESCLRSSTIGCLDTEAGESLTGFKVSKLNYLSFFSVYEVIA